MLGSSLSYKNHDTPPETPMGKTRLNRPRHLRCIIILQRLAVPRNLQLGRPEDAEIRSADLGRICALKPNIGEGSKTRQRATIIRTFHDPLGIHSPQSLTARDRHGVSIALAQVCQGAVNQLAADSNAAMQGSTCIFPDVEEVVLIVTSNQSYGATVSMDVKKSSKQTQS